MPHLNVTVLLELQRQQLLPLHAHFEALLLLVLTIVLCIVAEELQVAVHRRRRLGARLEIAVHVLEKVHLLAS